MANTTEQHGHLDFLKTAEIQNAIIQKLGTAPASPNEGQIYWDTALDTFRIYDTGGVAWISMLKDGDYGDVTIAGGETTLTIDNGVVTLAKMADIATDSFLGRNTAATGIVEVLTMAIATGMLDLFSTTTTAQGLVPGSNNGGASVYLDGSGVWSTPGGGGTVTSVSAGNGMDFTTITGSGPVTMGLPATLTSVTTNGVTTTSHTHTLDISGFSTTVFSDTANIAYLNGTETITGTWTIDTGTSLTITDAPSASTDAANKAYVDSVAQGLDAKDSVVAATTVNGALTTAYENLDVIDGVTLATNDRILIKDQTAPAENGIYIVNATGAPTRATDTDIWDELVSAFVFVEEGTVNADTGWVCTVDAGGTLDTTDVTFTQFSGAGSYTAGNGLDLTGTEFTLGTPSTLTGATTNAVTASSHTHAVTTGIADNDIVEIDSVDVASGEYAKFTAAGLESKTVTEMQSELGIIQKYSVAIGDTTTTNFTVTHNLGTRDVIVRVRETATPYTYIDVPIEADTTSAVGIDFLTAPGTDEYTVIVIG